jgi:hypothetical protein
MSFLALPQKRTKSRIKFSKVFGGPKTHKNYSREVRLNLSARKSQNFRLLRKALNVAHFGFSQTPGPENGLANAPFEY